MLRSLANTNNQYAIRQRVQRATLPNLESSFALHHASCICSSVVVGVGGKKELGFAEKRFDAVNNAHPEADGDGT